jgi:hypothetical protein
MNQDFHCGQAFACPPPAKKQNKNAQNSARECAEHWGTEHNKGASRLCRSKVKDFSTLLREMVHIYTVLKGWGRTGFSHVRKLWDENVLTKYSRHILLKAARDTPSVDVPPSFFLAYCRSYQDTWDQSFHKRQGPLPLRYACAPSRENCEQPPPTAW